MGRGDMKTTKGKRTRGSHGNTRPKTNAKSTTPVEAADKKKAAKPAKSAEKVETKVKKAPAAATKEKKVAEKKPAAKTEKKATEKKASTKSAE